MFPYNTDEKTGFSLNKIDLIRIIRATMPQAGGLKEAKEFVEAFFNVFGIVCIDNRDVFFKFLTAAVRFAAGEFKIEGGKIMIYRELTRENF